MNQPRTTDRCLWCGRAGTPDRPLVTKRDHLVHESCAEQVANPAREAVATWPPLPEELREKLRALLDPDSPGRNAVGDGSREEVSAVDDPDPLDERLLGIIGGWDGQRGDDARGYLTCIREAWRGGDYYKDAAEALAVIEENAAALRLMLNNEEPPDWF